MKFSRKKTLKYLVGIDLKTKQTNSIEKLFIINLLPDAVSNFANNVDLDFLCPGQNM